MGAGEATLTVTDRPRSTEPYIRPIEPTDKVALAAAVEEMSKEARYRRFLSSRGPLTAAELRYLTEIDHRDHEALAAFDPSTSEGLGVARYVRDPEHRHSAEIAVAVREPFQGHGVGKALVRRLADRARAEGITQFTALVLADNQPSRRLLADLGATRVLSAGAGAVELVVDLHPSSKRVELPARPDFATTGIGTAADDAGPDNDRSVPSAFGIRSREMETDHGEH